MGEIPRTLLLRLEPSLLVWPSTPELLLLIWNQVLGIGSSWATLLLDESKTRLLEASRKKSWIEDG
jgi:hypothetical protein